METISKKYNSVKEYISDFKPEVNKILKKIRLVIEKAAPEAQELISYNMPTYKLHGNLIHFAAFKSHIGLYPGPDALNAFPDETAKYKTAKGSIQFPLEDPIPFQLIKKITEFCVKEKQKNK